MSNFILLTGNGVHNKEWIERVGGRFSDLFDSIHIQHYRHWSNGGEFIDLEHELDELTNFVKGKKDYYLFGKSMGSVLAIKGIQEKKLNPKECVFCGLPVLWARKNGYPIDEIIEGYNHKTSFIQNSRDPYLYGDDMIKYFTERNMENYFCCQVDGFNHEYEDLDILYQIMESCDFSN